VIYDHASMKRASVILLVFAPVLFAQQPAPKHPRAADQRLQLAITFDDLPAHGPLPPGVTRMEVATKIIRTLHNGHVPPTYGFVNGALVERQPADIEVLKAWHEAGNPVGNHTWSHLNLNQHTLDDFEAEVERNEPLLKQLMDNNGWHWFRFPFLAEGETPQKHDAVRTFLLQRGYKIAAVTMSFADYSWNEPYARCAAKNDSKSIDVLRKTYLSAAEENIAFYRDLSHSLFQRDIPYVLLMHIGAFDAEMLPRLLDLYRSKGFEFESLPDAESDDFYKVVTDIHAPSGPDSLEGMASARHIAFPPRTSYDQQLQSLCR
jgi:peptidoglycan/xylan/chitin deacetylase (PgdA/CDA1 family)